MIENGSKWSKKQKKRSEVRESELLNEKIKEDRSARKMDQAEEATDGCLEHLAGKKERQAGEALKTRVKRT